MAGLTVKRDDVTGLAPTGDLALIEKSSLRLDSLLLMFGPGIKKTKKTKSGIKSIKSNLCFERYQLILPLSYQITRKAKNLRHISNVFPRKIFLI